MFKVDRIGRLTPPGEGVSDSSGTVCEKTAVAADSSNFLMNISTKKWKGGKNYSLN